MNLETNKRSVASLTFRTKAFIGGRLVDSVSGKAFATQAPGTGERLAEIAECDAPDVDAAVQAARAAFEKGSWSRLGPAERKKGLLKFADLIEGHSAELALLECVEAGKTIHDCTTIDLPDVVNTLRWYAEAIDKVYDQVSPTAPNALGLIVREPVGVAAAVLPWNFPAMMAAWKLGPALAAGNSIILKPAEQTSLGTIRLAELAACAGIPDGVVNVVPGYGPTAGQAIGRHPGIDMVSFTGSAEVGRLFLRYAAESNLKQVVLECGGKSPQLVLGDVADLDNVARNAVFAGFWSSGQNCSCGSRLIAHKSLKDRLVQKVVDVSQEWRVGDPLDPATRLGPLIDRGQLDRVMGYIATGRREGANLVSGGKQVLEHSGGAFVEPTVFDNVRNTMTIAREEIFGPVLSVITFDTEEEAIALANDSSYGLAASVYTDDVNAAHRVARAIKAGVVAVNCYSEGDITTPFGGYKQSGFGGRDKSLYALDQYTQLKTIWMHLR